MKFQLNWFGGWVSRHFQGEIPVNSKSQVKLIRKHTQFMLLATLAWGIASPVSAAERLTLRLGPIEQSIEIDDLEYFAETGELTRQLKPYRGVMNSQMRLLLTRRLQLDPQMTEKFINDLLDSSDGARLLKTIGQALPRSSVEQLQAALFLAARQANGLSVLSFLRSYPDEDVVIDATSALTIAVQLNTSYLQSQAVGPLLEQELKTADSQTFRPSFDPSKGGFQYVRERTLRLRDRERQRTILVDLYWSRQTSGPLVVLSHGFGSDRKFLNYLARHLASHGLTVASLEHPGSNFTWINGVSLSGNPGNLLSASEFIERPKDVSFVLNRLARFNQLYGRLRGKLNTEQVTMIGHSLGGYTALALAGGELDIAELRRFCKTRSPLRRSPADWFHCAATDLPLGPFELRDSRVAQVIAFNSITGQLFGKDGLANVTVPTLMLTGTEDAITPSLEHQLRPFEQLGGSKYLIAAIGGTHLSVTDEGNLNEAVVRTTLVREMIGTEAQPLRQLAKGVSLAFVKQLTPEAKTYEPFLTPAYAQSLSTSTLPLRFSRKLPPSIATWFQVMNLGEQQVAITLPPINRFSLKSFFSPSAAAMPRVGYYGGHLNRTFTKLLNNSDKNQTGLS